MHGFKCMGCYPPERGGDLGGGLLSQFLLGIRAAFSLSESLPAYFVANYRRLCLSHFWANMLFSRSQLSHFLLMYEMKNTQITFHQ